MERDDLSVRREIVSFSEAEQKRQREEERVRRRDLFVTNVIALRNAHEAGTEDVVETYAELVGEDLAYIEALALAVPEGGLRAALVRSFDLAWKADV
jgi:hypothetical protein